MKHILSKLLIAFMLCVINCSSLFAQNTITIVNEKAGKFQKTVEKKWKKEKKTIIPMSEVTRLCVEGIFDSNIDTKYLFQAFPNLEFLNLDKLNGNSISLNGASKLKELWAPSGCKYIATYEMPALQRLQIYCGTDLSEEAIVPFVYLKTVDDIGDPDFNSPFSESLIQTLVNTKRQNVGLLITSQNISDDHNIYYNSHRTSPYFIYSRKDNGVKLLKCEPYFTQDVLDHVTSFKKDCMYLLSELKLEEVTIKDGVTSIPEYCFSKNSTIKKVNLPTTITSIGESAFAPSRIETVNIPYGVSVIPKSCFLGCENIKYVEIPESVIKIQDNAFYGTSITDITIPRSVKTIEATVFSNVKNVHIKGEPFFYSNSFILSNVESITLDSYMPPTVHSVYGNWEENTTNIVVSIPEGSYGAYSQHPFWGKLNLAERGEKLSVNITSTKHGDFLTQLPPISDLPKIDSLTVTGFIYNTDLKILEEFKSLKYIDFSQAVITESPQSKRDAVEVALLWLIGMTEDDRPKGECYVPHGAFNNMTRLEHVKLPLQAKSIGRVAFKDCRNLKIVEIPLSVETIEDEVFSGCKSLTDIKMPSSINSLGEKVFSNCTSLEMVDLRHCYKIRGLLSLDAFLGYTGNIYLPEGITDISVYMSDYYGPVTFHFPKLLSKVSCNFVRDLTLYFYSQTPPALQSGMFRCKITNCTIYVPKGCKIPYYNAYGNSNKYIEQ